MVIKEQAVSNAANLSLFMVNVSKHILASTGETSILDLKAHSHCLRYAQEAFKILPKSATVISFADWVKEIPVLGKIHVQKQAA